MPDATRYVCRRCRRFATADPEHARCVVCGSDGPDLVPVTALLLDATGFYRLTTEPAYPIADGVISHPPMPDPRQQHTHDARRQGPQ